MKYMLLIYEDDDDRVENMEQRMPGCAAYVGAMQKAGVYVVGERLRAASTTTSVRLAEGRAQVVDGPYAEAKEQLGGFHIIDVPDLDAALAWAARCPSASRGVVEVRPVWPSGVPDRGGLGDFPVDPGRSRASSGKRGRPSKPTPPQEVR